MQNKQFEIVVTEEDGDLYRLIKNCSKAEYAKEQLKLAAELYTFCNAYDISLIGYYAPGIFREVALRGKTKEQLQEIRNHFMSELLRYGQCFTPEECDCGIRISPEGERWFIDESGVLGYVTLYSHYVEMVDEELRDLEK